jgi:hypothetical protein
MRRLKDPERLALGFVGSGCLLGAVLGLLWALVRGERDG